MNNPSPYAPHGWSPLQQSTARFDRQSDEMDANEDFEDFDASKSKKKRRVVKTSDRKYVCPQPDCGKSYSRAEHLYRHQLNRMSTKQSGLHQWMETLISL